MPACLQELQGESQFFDVAPHPARKATYVLLQLKAEVFPRLYEVRETACKRECWGLDETVWDWLNQQLLNTGQVRLTPSVVTPLLEFLRHCYTLSFRVMPWLMPVAKASDEGGQFCVLVWRKGTLSWVPGGD